MKLYEAYLQEIIERAKLGLGPKPIDQGNLLEEIIDIILKTKSSSRDDAVKHFIYNVLPGTTSAASVKAKFLKRVILKEASVNEIDQKLAFDLLSHMKGGPSVEVLLDLAFHEDTKVAEQAATVLKTQVFLYEADTNRLAKKYNDAFESLPIQVPSLYVNELHAMHLYVIELDRRNDLMEHLRANQIGASLHYPLAVHQHAAYAKRIRGGDDLANTERFYKKNLTLPLYPELSNTSIDFIISTVESWSRSL